MVSSFLSSMMRRFGVFHIGGKIFNVLICQRLFTEQIVLPESGDSLPYSQIQFVTCPKTELHLAVC